MPLSQSEKEERRLRKRDMIFGVLMLVTLAAWIGGGIWIMTHHL